MPDDFAPVEALLDLLRARNQARKQFQREEGLLNIHVQDITMHAQLNNNLEVRTATRSAVSQLEVVKTFYEKLRNLQDCIDIHPENEDRLENLDLQTLREEESTTVKFFKTYHDLKGKIEELRLQYLENTDLNQSQSTASSGADVAELLKTLVDSNDVKNARLIEALNQKKKNIDIPKFSGEIEFFDQWHDIILSEINSVNYTDPEKVHLILSHLEGDARKTAASLQEPSLEDILKELESKYGDIVRKIHNAVHDIEDVEKARNMSLKELERVYAVLTSSWNYLFKRCENSENLKSCSWIFTIIARRKLPRALIKQFDKAKIQAERDSSRNSTNLPFDFPEFLKHVREEITIARRTDIDKKHEINNEKNGKYKRNFSTGSASKISTKKKMEYVCAFCDGNHKSHFCKELPSLSIEKRWEKVKIAKACFNCLGINHIADRCYSRHCHICKRRHHTLLHVDLAPANKQRIENNTNEKEKEEKRLPTKLLQPQKSDWNQRKKIGFQQNKQLPKKLSTKIIDTMEKLQIQGTCTQPAMDNKILSIETKNKKFLYSLKKSILLNHSKASDEDFDANEFQGIKIAFENIQEEYLNILIKLSSEYASRKDIENLKIVSEEIKTVTNGYEEILRKLDTRNVPVSKCMNILGNKGLCVIQNDGDPTNHKNKLEDSFNLKFKTSSKKKQYLTELISFKKWTQKVENAKTGDVVIVGEDKMKRSEWLLGRIEETYPGRDGLVRSVRVKTTKGYLRRPVQKLYIMEPDDKEK